MTLKRLALFSLASLLALSVSACGDDNDTPVPSPDPAETASQPADLPTDEIPKGITTDKEMSKNDGWLGTYAGTTLTYGAPASTFYDDGWTVDQNFQGGREETITGLPVVNSKYPNVELTLYGITDNTAPEDTGVTFTWDELDKNGICGYTVDARYAVGSTLPDMTFNGVPFGAKIADITAVYGSPDEFSNSDGVVTMYFSTEDGGVITAMAGDGSRSDMLSGLNFITFLFPKTA